MSQKTLGDVFLLYVGLMGLCSIYLTVQCNPNSYPSCFFREGASFNNNGGIFLFVNEILGSLGLQRQISNRWFTYACKIGRGYWRNISVLLFLSNFSYISFPSSGREFYAPLFCSTNLYDILRSQSPALCALIIVCHKAQVLICVLILYNNSMVSCGEHLRNAQLVQHTSRKSVEVYIFKSPICVLEFPSKPMYCSGILSIIIYKGKCVPDACEFNLNDLVDGLQAFAWPEGQS